MYRPKFRPQQPDPTTSKDWFNCTMASAAMALDFHTQGKVQKWGGELRKAYDPLGKDPDGTNLDNVVTAWKKFGYTFVKRSGKTWADCIADLKNGKGVVLQGDYDVFTGADTCQGSFNGNHAIYLNPEFFDGGTTIAVADPLCGGFKRIKVTALKAYAEKLGTAVYGKKGPILYGVTRAWPTPVVPPVVPPVTPAGGDEMIVGEGLVRTSDYFIAVKSGVVVYSDPACTKTLTTMSVAADVDYMGTVPGNTTAWAIEIATGKIVSGKTLPVIAYIKRASGGVPTKRPVTADSTPYSQQQLDAAVAKAIADTKASAKSVTTVVFE